MADSKSTGKLISNLKFRRARGGFGAKVAFAAAADEVSATEVFPAPEGFGAELAFTADEVPATEVLHAPAGFDAELVFAPAANVPTTEVLPVPA
jgi:hypothetical protein